MSNLYVNLFTSSKWKILIPALIINANCINVYLDSESMVNSKFSPYMTCILSYPLHISGAFLLVLENGMGENVCHFLVLAFKSQYALLLLPLFLAAMILSCDDS